MNNKIFVPPIKSQGIKTKLVPWINDLVSCLELDKNRVRWIEPFFGTGVVGFNSGFVNVIAGDTNPHIINFYQKIQEGKITPHSVREYLNEQGKLLSASEEEGYAHYKFIRSRFNAKYDPLDFLFLSRAGFNGMMRFNSKGQWNIPFCKKKDRFAAAYITKICNQVECIQRIIKDHWQFINQSFAETIAIAGEDDIIYCDPPYYGRYVDYYNGWTEENEKELFQALQNTKARFILSTWHHNQYRENEMIPTYWDKFNIIEKDHFYHGGGKIENRQSIVEALVFNFDLKQNQVAMNDKRVLSLFPDL